MITYITDDRKPVHAVRGYPISKFAYLLFVLCYFRNLSKTTLKLDEV